MFSTDELRLLINTMLIHASRAGDVADGGAELLQKLYSLLRDREYHESFKGTVYIDIPDRETVENDEAPWINLAVVNSMAEGIAFIQEHIGNCDEDGRIALLSYGEREEEDSDDPA